MTTTTTTTTLLLIDVQKDFHPGGSLAIPNASEDASRIASFITKHAKSIHRIVVTLDTHPKWHIAHPTFWIAGDDNDDDQRHRHPAPFTVISSEDIRSKKWIPVPNSNPSSSSSSSSSSSHAIVDETIFAKGGPIPENLFVHSSTTQDGHKSSSSSSQAAFNLATYCAEYAHRLESGVGSNRKFSLTIWPEHCLEGTDGHSVVDVVSSALSTWSAITGGKVVEYVKKGMNPYTEMFSAICAEVPVDGETSFNCELVDSVSVILFFHVSENVVFQSRNVVVSSDNNSELGSPLPT
jgi:nicotinamidase/pyrazinamidase